jgi:branched-chain amino acid transport system substrate-binding protein
LELKGTTLYAVIAVVLIAGLGIGYVLMPTKAGATVTVIEKALPLKGTTVKIGYIASSTAGLETAKPFRDVILSRDANKYAAALGYDTKFVIQIDDANGLAPTHLEKVQGFKSLGIEVFEGGLWSSQAQGSLAYCDTNKMLMWSTSSTSPTLAIAGDYLYRLCPADSFLAPALVEVAWSYGIKHLVFFQRGDSWGDGIKNLVEPAWKLKGGDFLGDTIRYATEATEFANYLAVADTQITDALAKGYKLEEIGGILLSFNEAPVIVSQGVDYPNIYKIRWFGADGTAKSQYVRDQSPAGALAMKIFSLYAAASTNEIATKADAEYQALTKLPLGSYGAYSYDLNAIIMPTSFFLTQSIKGVDNKNVADKVCYQTFGAGGWNKLNEYGDRSPPPFDIWGFGLVDGKCDFRNYGTFDNDSKKTTWNKVALALDGLTPKLIE